VHWWLLVLVFQVSVAAVGVAIIASSRRHRR
jgi:hypothetical protein